MGNIFALRSSPSRKDMTSILPFPDSQTEQPRKKSTHKTTPFPNIDPSENSANSAAESNPQLSPLNGSIRSHSEFSEYKDSEPVETRPEFDFALTEGQCRRGLMADCENECSEIFPYLFVGGAKIAESWDILQSHHIVRVINCSASVVPSYHANKASMKYLTLNMLDGRQDDISWFFCEVIQFIHQAKLANENCLVHCEKGVSRSCSFVIAYHMWLIGSSWKQAFDFVKCRRTVCAPNTAFTCNLIEIGELLNGDAKSSTVVLRCAWHLSIDSETPVLKLCRNTETRKLLAPTAALLDSKGVFVVRAGEVDGEEQGQAQTQATVQSGGGQKLYIWHGSECQIEAVHAARRLASLMIGVIVRKNVVVEVVEVGSEPSSFLSLMQDSSSSGVTDCPFEDLFPCSNPVNTKLPSPGSNTSLSIGKTGSSNGSLDSPSRQGSFQNSPSGVMSLQRLPSNGSRRQHRNNNDSMDASEPADVDSASLPLLHVLTSREEKTRQHGSKRRAPSETDQLPQNAIALTTQPENTAQPAAAQQSGTAEVVVTSAAPLPVAAVPASKAQSRLPLGLSLNLGGTLSPQSSVKKLSSIAPEQLGLAPLVSPVPSPHSQGRQITDDKKFSLTLPIIRNKVESAVTVDDVSDRGKEGKVADDNDNDNDKDDCVSGATATTKSNKPQQQIQQLIISPTSRSRASSSIVDTTESDKDKKDSARERKDKDKEKEREKERVFVSPRINRPTTPHTRSIEKLPILAIGALPNDKQDQQLHHKLALNLKGNTSTEGKSSEQIQPASTMKSSLNLKLPSVCDTPSQAQESPAPADTGRERDTDTDREAPVPVNRLSTPPTCSGLPRGHTSNNNSAQRLALTLTPSQQALFASSTASTSSPGLNKTPSSSLLPQLHTPARPHSRETGCRLPGEVGLVRGPTSVEDLKSANKASAVPSLTGSTVASLSFLKIPTSTSKSSSTNINNNTNSQGKLPSLRKGGIASDIEDAFSPVDNTDSPQLPSKPLLFQAVVREDCQGDPAQAPWLWQAMGVYDDEDMIETALLLLRCAHAPHFVWIGSDFDTSEMLTSLTDKEDMLEDVNDNEDGTSGDAHHTAQHRAMALWISSQVSFLSSTTSTSSSSSSCSRKILHQDIIIVMQGDETELFWAAYNEGY